ncbi:MAG: acyl-CoA dehydrogenase family protein [Desulfatiglans sp.]|nr:acyl-CoA dehydrogenase family protein [Thermodesulfobacteriota bacterium]MEE4353253.1 acyl-CoA dehydrogenase family protein [Desulfatiglans sp.]
MEFTYQLTKKQVFFQKNIDRFVRQEISPRAREIDRSLEFPHDVLEQLAGNHLLGLPVSKEAGGEGAGFLDVCLALEGIAQVCPTSALICSVQNLGAHLVATAGTPAQKEKYLRDILEGVALFGYDLPDTLSLHPGHVMVSASQEGEGYQLHGPGCFVMNGDMSKVIRFFAKREEEVLVFLVERETRGLEVVQSELLEGSEARCTCKAVLNSCFVPSDNLMGNGAGGKEIMDNQVACASIFTAARSLGSSQGALDYAVEYAKQREQFGLPIGKFQAVQVLLADMEVKVEASRHLVYKAASVLDQKGRESKRFSSMARYFVSKMAGEVTADAVQIGGAYGYTRDYPLEKFMRNAQLSQVLEGTNHAHQLAYVKTR